MTSHPKDPSQNYLEKIPQPLDRIFFPRSVALIGAKDDRGSVARTLLKNLMTGKELPLYPINPKRKEVLGVKCYPDLSSLPEPVDLAIIVTPAHTVPAIIAECVEAQARSVIIISAGFKELGEKGRALEEEILKLSRKANMPIIGPNCLGVMNPLFGINATFAKGMANKGNIAFLSQSGALCTAVLDWSFQENLGFSAFVSVGSMADVGWGELITYFGNDPNTESILLYMETIGNPQAFLSAAREVTLQKPIVVIKPGRSSEAAQAAASHTGSLVGDDAVFDAAMERVGVMRVDTISELFELAEVLAKQPLPKGPNLGILTNAGGPAVIATDAAIRNGASIPSLTKTTEKKLSEFLPAAWSHHNPVDILGDASAETYRKTLEVMLQDPEFDGILTILTPQDMTEPLETAESLASHRSDIPMLASWMGAKSVEKANLALNEAGISTFAFPDEAAAAFARMWHHSVNLHSLYELVSPGETIDIQSYAEQKKRVQKAREWLPKSRAILSEEASKSLLSLYGIPVVETEIAKTAEEAVAKAANIGYPVVLKLLSATITHKSDVGGVKLNLGSAEEVKEAFTQIQSNVAPDDFDGVTVQKMISFKGYELIIGSSIDPQFGPVILFGAGGEMVEIYQDTALGLPPLEPVNALRLMEKTRIYQAFKGYRGRGPVPLDRLTKILQQFSTMILENPWIQECDINPLLAGSEGIVALDARIVADPDKMTSPVIRPYPYQYCLQKPLRTGETVLLRPIRGSDLPLLKAFHKELSEETVHKRYLQFLSLSERVAEERLVRICLNDYTHEYVLVAEPKERDSIVGIIRLSRIPSSDSAQLFMVIADAYQNKGLGTLLLEQIIHVAENENVSSIQAKILSENEGMIRLCEKAGFEAEREGAFVLMRKPLQPTM